jgi:cytochrome c-type biogenesis protein CcmF
MFEAGQQGIMRNPDIVSHLTSDFYLSPIGLEPPEDGAAPVEYTLQKGQTLDVGGVAVTFAGFAMGGHMGEGMSQKEAEAGVGASLLIQKDDQTEAIAPRLIPSTEGSQHPGVPSRLLGGEVQLLTMEISMGEGPSVITIGLARSGEQGPKPDVLVGEASIKPFIGLVWTGTVLMMIGFALAIVKRWRD